MEKKFKNKFNQKLLSLDKWILSSKDSLEIREQQNQMSKSLFVLTKEFGFEYPYEKSSGRKSSMYNNKMLGLFCDFWTEVSEHATNKINSYDNNFEGFLDTNDAIKSLEETSKILTSKIKSYLEEDDISKKNIKKFNEQLIALEKSFISDKGMYFGAWYKSIYASSDPFSGYGAWILPGLEYEIALKSSERLKEWDSRYSNAINSLESKMKNLIQEIN